MTRLITKAMALLVLALLTTAADGGCDSGSGGGGGEGSEGAEGGGGNAASLVATTTTRGQAATLEIAPAEAYSGSRLQLEQSYVLDAGTIRGSIKNEATTPVCGIQIGIHSVDASGAETLIATVVTSSLTTNQQAEFAVPSGGAVIDAYLARTESFTCSSVAIGGEGGNEGPEGAEGPGGGGASGGGDESSPSRSRFAPFAGRLGVLDFDFAWNQQLDAFEGQVDNFSGALACRVRTEVHLGTPTGVVELGPTVPVDLAAGSSQRVVIETRGIAFDTWTLHPETSPCP